MEQSKIVHKSVGGQSSADRDDGFEVPFRPSPLEAGPDSLRPEALEMSPASLVPFKHLKQFPAAQLIKVLLLLRVGHLPPPLRVLDEVLLQQCLQLRQLVSTDGALLGL